jgi:hypothetical protein
MKTRLWTFFICCILLSVACKGDAAEKQVGKIVTFPLGTATPPEVCGACHVAIYREYAMGVGGDIQYQGIIYKSVQDKMLTLPASVSTTATAHALAGLNPFPVHARDIERGGASCDVCHFPLAFEIPDLENIEVGKPLPRPPGDEESGVTCASCHVTPEGTIRGPYEVDAPHATVADPRIHTSAMCAYCHSMDKRIIGKQTQTFLEWREDFHKPGLGSQHCQDCHMPRTLRKIAEDFDVPVRAVARHLWTGGHSSQRVRTATSLVLVQPKEGQADVELHVINIAAGHSAPSGTNRRGLYLIAEAQDKKGKILARQQWLFAPWYGNRPDDRAFLEADKSLPDALSALQADEQGPHEAPVRAGEDRVLHWIPQLKAGAYAVHARLVYDLNRYNDPFFSKDRTEANRASMALVVQ